MVVVESAEPGGRGGVRGGGIGHAVHRKRAVAAMISNQQLSVCQLGYPEVGPQNQRQ
jgi:hypothetical protein